MRYTYGTSVSMVQSLQFGTANEKNSEIYSNNETVKCATKNLTKKLSIVKSFEKLNERVHEKLNEE